MDTPEEAVRLSLRPEMLSVYCEQFLQIQAKELGLIRLVPNAAQRLLFDTWRRQKAKGGGVNIIALKARQVGWSTGTEALCYRETTTNYDFYSTIIAHEAVASANLYRMFRLFYDHCPEQFRPQRKSSGNEQGLEFPELRSAIRVLTAENPDASASATNQFIHISELAKWRNPDAAMASLMQTLTPKGTAIVESTALGYGGYFYEMWRDAVNGASGWVPLFFAWWQHEEYRMPLEQGEAIYPTAEEQPYVDRFRLDGEQVKWMRWCRDVKCNKSWDVFRQEYPAFPDEAFLASGRPVFNVPALIARDATLQGLKPRRVHISMAGEMLNMSDNSAGIVEIYAEPVRGWNRRYAIGADSAEGRSVDRSLTARRKGSGDSDCNAAYVLDRVTGEQVAYARSQQTQFEWAETLFALAMYYAAGNPQRAGWPMIAPEVNNSTAVIARLRELFINYRVPLTRILHRAETMDGEFDVPTERLGFRTDQRSKASIIAALQEMIVSGTDGIKSAQTVSECMTMAYDGEGRMAAQSGHWDDSVMACAIAHFADRFDSPPGPITHLDKAAARRRPQFGRRELLAKKDKVGYWTR